MRKFFVAAAALFALAACEESWPPAMKFSPVGLIEMIGIYNVETSGASITELSLVARPGQVDQTVLQTATFYPGFTAITPPQDPPTETLVNITSDFPAGFTFSDPEARTVAYTEIVCDMTSSGTIDNILHLYLDCSPETYELHYVYSDRPTTVTGEGSDWWGTPTVYNLNLRKGWNMVVEKTDWAGGGKRKTVTQQMPEGMKWFRSQWLGE